MRYAAFDVGENDKHINMVDAFGVALAAIEELYRMDLEQGQRIAQLTSEIEEGRKEGREWTTNTT